MLIHWVRRRNRDWKMKPRNWDYKDKIQMRPQRVTSCLKPKIGLESSFLHRLEWEKFLCVWFSYYPSALWLCILLMLESMYEIERRCSDIWCFKFLVRVLNNVYHGKRIPHSKLIWLSISFSWSTFSSGWDEDGFWNEWKQID